MRCLRSPHLERFFVQRFQLRVRNGPFTPGLLRCYRETVMILNRRGMVAALICSPVVAQTLKRENGTIVLDLNPEAAGVTVLEVRYKNKIVKFTADEVMSALEPVVFPLGPYPLTTPARGPR
jgi:hypothetical protein